jgi:predicted phage-related endonuclease
VRIEYHGTSPVFGAIEAAFPESEAQWLNFRRDYLSASEFGAAAGVHKFETIQEVIAKKKSGERTPTNPAMQMGHDLEPKVAEAAAQKWGWEIRKIDYFLFSQSHKVGASLDYIVRLEDGTWCPLEIKTTAEKNLKYGWLSGIPKHNNINWSFNAPYFPMIRAEEFAYSHAILSA